MESVTSTSSILNHALNASRSPEICIVVKNPYDPDGGVAWTTPGELIA